MSAAPTKSVVLITGAAGWLGGLLAEALIVDPDSPDVHLILADIVEPKAPARAHVITLKTDLTIAANVESLFETTYGIPDVVYAMHGIMSRGSEDNFDLGLKVNVDSVRSLLDAARHRGTSLANGPIKFIFCSSLAVYGGQLVSPLVQRALEPDTLTSRPAEFTQPDVITPDTIATPEGAYGAGKLMSELLINEYSRRGFVDGRILRLPTIIVRPGVPSNATSAFLSGIVREPLKGLQSICPIGNALESSALELAAWVASPPTTIRNLVRARHVPTADLRPHTRVICLPGFTATVREELDALRAVAGPDAVACVMFKDDPVNRRIVSSWPAKFDNTYALSLGFFADEGGMEPIVRSFKEDVEAGRA